MAGDRKEQRAEDRWQTTEERESKMTEGRGRTTERIREDRGDGGV